jgi:hypothetical protein
MQHRRTSFDVTAEPLKVQLETFLDEHRAALRSSRHPARGLRPSTAVNVMACVHHTGSACRARKVSTDESSSLPEATGPRHRYRTNWRTEIGWPIFRLSPA